MLRSRSEITNTHTYIFLSTLTFPHYKGLIVGDHIPKPISFFIMEPECLFGPKNMSLLASDSFSLLLTKASFVLCEVKGCLLVRQSRRQKGLMLGSWNCHPYVYVPISMSLLTFSFSLHAGL